MTLAIRAPELGIGPDGANLVAVVDFDNGIGGQDDAAAGVHVTDGRIEIRLTVCGGNLLARFDLSPAVALELAAGLQLAVAAAADPVPREPLVIRRSNGMVFDPARDEDIDPDWDPIGAWRQQRMRAAARAAA